MLKNIFIRTISKFTVPIDQSASIGEDRKTPKRLVHYGVLVHFKKSPNT